MDESITLSDALSVVQGAKYMIKEVEILLPSSLKKNFRERLVSHLADANGEFQEKARKLLLLYKDRFGVKDIVDDLEER